MRFSPPQFRKIEQLFHLAMTQAHIPGLSIAAVEDDQITYERAFGIRNLKNHLPATPHTIYGIGSCTKSFTALAVLLLVDEGKLNVHDPVKTYLPFHVGAEHNPITIHHLLTHSSGIPNLGAIEMLIKRLIGMKESDLPMDNSEDLLTFVNDAQKEVAALPGERFFYSNEGYTLLGEIIEQVSGKLFHEFVTEKILTPLKMKRSFFSEEKFQKENDRAIPYYIRKKKSRIAVEPGNHPFHKLIYPSGGLLSCVDELAHFLIAYLNDGIFEGTSIVDPMLLKEAFRPHIEKNPTMIGESAYGYGWSIMKDFLGYKCVTHEGSIGMSSGYLAFLPDLSIGVAMACNTGQVPLMNLIPLGLLAHLMGKDLQEEIPFFERERHLLSLTGKYESYKGLHKVSVEKRGGLLYLKMSEEVFEMEVPLIPESNTINPRKFYIQRIDGKIPVEFVITSSGIDLYVERDYLHKTSSFHATAE